MEEMVKLVPLQADKFLLILFFIESFCLAVITPVTAFAVGASVWMCYILYVLNYPAIVCTEDPLYGKDPQGFIDFKIKTVFRLWAIGIILLIILVAAGSAVAYLPKLELDSGMMMSEFNLTSYLVLFMATLPPFIPATFVIMKATYIYEDKWMAGTTLVIVLLMVAGILLSVKLALDSTIAPVLPTFDALIFLPLSVCILAVSLYLSIPLSKSARKSFYKYFNGEN